VWENVGWDSPALISLKISGFPKWHLPESIKAPLGDPRQVKDERAAWHSTGDRRFLSSRLSWKTGKRLHNELENHRVFNG
jgi:hypothetical protein